MSLNKHRISEIQEMIRRHQEAVKSSTNLAGHNQTDEDLCKVASIDVIGKGVQHTDDELKK